MSSVVTFKVIHISASGEETYIGHIQVLGSGAGWNLTDAKKILRPGERLELVSDKPCEHCGKLVCGDMGHRLTNHPKLGTCPTCGRMGSGDSE